MPILEISDLITHRDMITGASLAVRRDDVVAALGAAGDRRGARIAASLPHRAGVLDQPEIEKLLVRTHTELQRLNEELRIAEQLAELLGALLVAGCAVLAVAGVLAVEPCVHNRWYAESV